MDEYLYVDCDARMELACVDHLGLNYNCDTGRVEMVVLR